MKKIENLVKNNVFVNRMFTFFGSLVMKLLGIFVKKEPNSVLFVSYMGKNFNDSPKKIFDEMIKDPYFSNYSFYWAFKSPEMYTLPSNVKKIKIDTFKYFVVSLKADIWVTNVNIERGLHYKKNHTVYINSWHGIPLKKVGNDVQGRNDFDFSNTSYFPYSGNFEKEIYMRAFKLNESNLKKVGMPRNDQLISNDNLDVRSRIDSMFSTKSKIIILYAPTWRDTKLEVIDTNNWLKRLGEDYVIFLRSHGLSKEFEFENTSQVIDVSEYEETSDLILASDLLVTDYSSIMFDYSLTGKPIYIYGYDYEDYMSSRGTYFDIRDCGLNFYYEEEPLLNAIVNRDDIIEKNKTLRFKGNFFDYSEGNSTESIIEFLKNKS